MDRDDWTISIDNIDWTEVTDISSGTKAQYVYDLYCAKRKMLADLKFECDLLVDKYHSEMKNAHIPLEFEARMLVQMFCKDKKDKDAIAATKFARQRFLERGFSKDFIKKHNIRFISYAVHGYSRIAIGVVLGIGNYRYTIQFPLPKNIYKDEDKETLVGDVKFRVDRLHKSKENEFVKYMEVVCMPTYDWKKCFEAIEADVAQNAT